MTKHLNTNFVPRDKKCEGGGCECCTSISTVSRIILRTRQHSFFSRMGQVMAGRK